MKKNIILLMTDQHRSEYVGYSKNSKIDTPNIDKIASGISFSCCQTVNPVCTPARCALITGKYSHQIGELQMSGDLSLHHRTFMKALREEGYHTIGIGKFHFLQTWPWNTKRGFGIDLVALKEKMKEYGFDEIWETAGKQLALKNYCDYCKYLDNKGLLEKYRDFVESKGPNYSTPKNWPEDDGEPCPLNEEDYIDIVTADKIIEHIKKRPKDKPFYLFGSFCSPHKPFDPPKSYIDMVSYEEIDDFILAEGEELSLDEKKHLYRKRQSYKAMIKLIDNQIGRIFETLSKEGILDETVILFTSDHGEMLGDHYRIQKQVPYSQASTVPAAIYHPDYLNKIRNSSPIEIIDFAATILDIAGIDVKAALSIKWPAFNNIVPCKSLMPIIKGEKDSIRSYSFSECNNQWQMIQNEDFKYIRYLEYDKPGEYIEELYDLKEDPNECINVINREKYKTQLKNLKDYRDYIMDTTPAAQTSFAPLIEN